MIVIKTGDSFAEADENIFNILLEMREIILPFEWHSFCISIDPANKLVKLYHNNHIQAEQHFTIENSGEKGMFRLLTRGHVGGQKFVGYITDLQVFESVVADDVLFDWTSCTVQVDCIETTFNLSLYINAEQWGFIFLNCWLGQNSLSNSK